MITPRSSEYYQHGVGMWLHLFLSGQILISGIKTSRLDVPAWVNLHHVLRQVLPRSLWKDLLGRWSRRYHRLSIHSPFIWLSRSASGRQNTLLSLTSDDTFLAIFRIFAELYSGNSLHRCTRLDSAQTWVPRMLGLLDRSWNGGYYYIGTSCHSSVVVFSYTNPFKTQEEANSLPRGRSSSKAIVN